MSDETPKPSIWKRDISFGRKKPKEAAPEEAAAAPEAADEGAPAKTPFWKKELSLRRRTSDAPEPVEAIADDVAAEPVEEGPPVELDPEPTVEMDVVAPAPPPVAAPATPPAAPPPAGTHAAPPSDVPQAEAPPVPSYDWLTADLASEPEAETESEPVAEPVSAAPDAPTETPSAEPPVAQAPPVAAAPAPIAPAPPVPEPAAPVLPDPHPAAPAGWAVEPELPPAVAEPVVAAAAEIHPPVPAAELPPLAAPEQPKKSFFKREISFGRKKTEPTAPAGEVQVPVPASELPPVPASEQPKKSLLKREISFGRKKARAGDDGKAKREKTPKAEKQPKGEKEPKQPKQPKAAKRSRAGGTPKTHKKLVGLKIGASQIAAAQVVNNGAAEVVQVAREELEPGVVVGGELRDPEALAAALQGFFKKHKLPRRGIRLGIANNRIGVRTFDIAGIEDSKQLANAIRFRAQEALPIPIEEAVLDYQILGEGVDEEGNRSQRVLLVVAYRELIDRYLTACRKAGIQLVGIDLEAFALLRALAEPAPHDAPSQAALVAVSIGHERSTFAVSDGRVCEFTRVLEWGGSALNVAIARALDTTPSEAEPVKRVLSLASETTPEGLTDDAAAKAREAVRRQIQTFARELVSSLQFYQNQPDSLGIGEIVITGGTAHLDGLAHELERLIGVSVRVADPLARVRQGKKLREAEQIGSLAVAIGLGIED